ncbi:Uncharacterised protein [Streptococcus suis]|uniref:Lactococcin 972 family bacteriocin n=1 Tax=Streptococcus suis TaxID=1307 RepID=A0A116L4X1_STRSU|nr:hypothetical protein [Streptococcus suis]NQH35066.1 hypothetical protein [Streptococcus suis]CYU72870.1 Uncharacterised protein [Streptococcus suis]
MKKIVLKSFLLIAIVGVGASASALTYDAFFGGVTGVPGKGTTWGEYTPNPRTGRAVSVTAVGKTRRTDYGSRVDKAYASVARAMSGNRSYWNYR